MTAAIPSPVRLYHFTHVRNLPSILARGLESDTAVRGTRKLSVEAGDPEIKQRRRSRAVSVPPGGVVGDYVPFYFAPRSPMLYKLTRGGVPTFSDDPHDLVYLCTTVGILQKAGLTIVMSDRNAAMNLAEFSSDPVRWQAPGFIDWPLRMKRTGTILWTTRLEWTDVWPKDLSIA